MNRFFAILSVLVVVFFLSACSQTPSPTPPPMTSAEALAECRSMCQMMPTPKGRQECMHSCSGKTQFCEKLGRNVSVARWSLEDCEVETSPFWLLAALGMTATTISLLIVYLIRRRRRG